MCVLRRCVRVLVVHQLITTASCSRPTSPWLVARPCVTRDCIDSLWTCQHTKHTTTAHNHSHPTRHLTRPALPLLRPQTGKIYSFNEGNMDLWDQNVRDYITSLKDPSKWDGKPYSVSGALPCVGPAAAAPPHLLPVRPVLCYIPSPPGAGLM
jgi:hypothetical protein